ncbi:conserved hypothetical protein [Catalinimonas alkaloidigena]|uniref:DUF4440 domain-containing protein n=1 Tax=Catalinimonas alkaloidigena TaxID=1075417 RepID=A0A1G9H2A1_9BACT|nr:SgcJ/EcaC family oxidoreductase [Catalinimonas alkaloidigena]SDL06999.1 conserved hypothetical protein [Catalinimonas alkaloidigena]
MKATLLRMIATPDETQLIELFDHLADAWNRGDAQRFASYFTHDCDYVTFAGQHLKGQKAHREAHEKLFRGLLRGSRLQGRVRQIRFLSPDLALVHGTGTVQLRWQRKPSTRRESLNTSVVVRQDDGWKITAFHNVRIQPPGVFHRLRNALRLA